MNNEKEKLKSALEHYQQARELEWYTALRRRKRYRNTLIVAGIIAGITAGIYYGGLSNEYLGISGEMWLFFVSSLGGELILVMFFKGDDNNVVIYAVVIYAVILVIIGIIGSLFSSLFIGFFAVILS